MRKNIDFTQYDIRKMFRQKVGTSNVLHSVMAFRFTTCTLIFLLQPKTWHSNVRGLFFNRKGLVMNFFL